MASLLSVFKKQPKKDPVEEVKQVKTDIRAQIAKLRQTRAVKEKQCQDLLRSALAKKKQKNIIGAKDDLRKKELLKTSIMHINGQILGLETQLNAHDQAEMSREFLATMTASAKSLKNLVKETHVNETEAAAADIQESMQLVQQLQQATSQSLGITSTNDVCNIHANTSCTLYTYAYTSHSPHIVIHTNDRSYFQANLRNSASKRKKPPRVMQWMLPPTS